MLPTAPSQDVRIRLNRASLFIICIYIHLNYAGIKRFGICCMRYLEMVKTYKKVFFFSWITHISSSLNHLRSVLVSVGNYHLRNRIWYLCPIRIDTTELTRSYFYLRSYMKKHTTKIWGKARASVKQSDAMCGTEIEKELFIMRCWRLEK